MRKSNITLAAIPSLQQKSPAAAFCRRGLFHLVFTCPVRTQVRLQDVLSVHSILLFSQLVDQGVLVQVYHIVCDQGALLDVALHHCVLVDQAERYIALLGRFLLCADGAVRRVAADSVEVLACLQVDLSPCDARRGAGLPSGRS